MADQETTATLDSEQDFEEPVTKAHKIGVTEPTNTETKASKKTSSFASEFAKAIGRKPSAILSYNERTRTIVTNDGGKYQMSKKGKGVRHLAGPALPADLKLEVLDARSRSPFVGTAAAINASVHEDRSSRTALLAREQELKAELSTVRAELKETAEEE